MRRLLLWGGVLLLGAACGGEQKLARKPPVCQDGVDCCAPAELLCEGDPDRPVCTCRFAWVCDNLWFPSKCSQDHAGAPDGGGGWRCSVDQELERCERPGSSAPGAKNGWSCEVVGATVVCTRPTSSPDGALGWECSFVDGVKRCEKDLGPGLSPGIPGISTSGCGSTTPPEVLILLDRSGSMADPIAGTSKWSQATASVNDLVLAFRTKLRFGLMLFPSGGCSAGTIDVPVGADSANAIAAALAAATPLGGTPIAASLGNSAAAMTASRRYVLLVTDGGETCDGDPVAQVMALSGMQIRTYLVGFGSGVDAAQLNALAVAGGTALPAAAKYYQADNQAQLRQALAAIAGQVCQ